MNLSSTQYSNLGDWKWEASADALTGWEDITDVNATDTSTYTPSASDEGMFLRAYVTYTDSDGVFKRGLSPTIGPVTAAASQ